MNRATPLNPSKRPYRYRTAKLSVLVLVAALALAACGSSSSPSKSASKTSSAHSTVKTAKISGLGTVLVNSQGRTLYLLTADHDKVTCTTSNGCAAVWPPLELASGKPVAGPGVKSSLLGTIKSGGHTVVTYNQWPLYTFAKDSSAGQAKGEGIHAFGGSWYVVSTTGNAIKTRSKTAPTSSGGYSGGY